MTQDTNHKSIDDLNDLDPLNLLESDLLDENLEPNTSKTNTSETNASQSASDDNLVLGESADQSDDTFSKRVFQNNQHAKRYTIMFLAGCVAILAALYVVGRHHHETKTDDAEGAVSPLDLAMAKLEVALLDNNNAQDVIQRLVGDMRDHQVPLAQLERNPFRPLGFQQDGSQQTRQRRQNRLAQLNDSFKTLHLDSTLINTQQPSCMINGEVYGLGQPVDDDFTVKTIQPEQVILTAEQIDFVLSF